jgi:polar amino acid transport system permease protein
MDFTWLPKYLPIFGQGLVLTITLVVVTMIFGVLLAIPLGLAQVTGPKWLGKLARGYCTLMRGTPLLVQLYLLYFGLGAVFAATPEIRQSFFWPVLREGIYYAVVAFVLNEAGYAGEIMRGAFLSVSKGELEAARAYGMSPWKVLTRVWLPRALRNALPALGGEAILTLKATPLVTLVALMDFYGAADRVRQETYIIYPPLLFVMAAYLIMTSLIALGVNRLEALSPVRKLK